MTETFITDDGFGMISVDYVKEKPDVAFIHDLSVIPFSRKIGMGNALLAHAIKSAKERQCECVELEYFHQITPTWVREWYERNGFEEIAFIENHSTLMRKKL